jgi:hypothetical protein
VVGADFFVRGSANECKTHLMIYNYTLSRNQLFRGLLRGFSSYHESQSPSVNVSQSFGLNRVREYHLGEKVVLKPAETKTVEYKLSEEFVTFFDLKGERISPLAKKLLLPFSLAIPHFLPANYPHSVKQGYASFSKFRVASSIVGTCGSVLSMQCLLFAVGLNANTALPAAAALNWILKDGLGQLGGVLYASFARTLSDSQPKTYRLLSAFLLNVSCVIEILTPLVPSLFLPIATLANIGKNVAWIAASATQAAIHKSFINRENLGDVTAKAGTQTIAASVVGTALGVVLSSAIGQETVNVLAAYTGLALLQMWWTYRSLQSVTVPYLNMERMEQICAAYFSPGGVVPSPHTVNASEQFALPVGLRRSFFRPIAFEISPPVNQFVLSASELYRLQQLFGGSSSTTTSDRGEECRSACRSYLINVGKLSGLRLQSGLETLVDGVIARELKVMVVFFDGAQSRDLLRAMLQTNYLRYLLMNLSDKRYSLESLLQGILEKKLFSAGNKCR